MRSPTTESWGVSILAADAEPTSRWFATKGRPLAGQLERSGHHRSPSSAWRGSTTALATLECRTVAIHQAGDHDIVIGEVVELEIGTHDDRWTRCSTSAGTTASFLGGVP